MGNTLNHGLSAHDLIAIQIQREPWFQDLMAESFPGWKGSAGYNYDPRHMSMVGAAQLGEIVRSGAARVHHGAGFPASRGELRWHGQ
ncbi:hypothetical protein [Frigidibacter sp. SD6-1]|uniref:hypothetical protein n=1 Tax=Frigidibacter sp. SD6-1 TaxID=3032581 RepID=UPI0024DF6195|nr:hypothetical protein [Frigidibacter sp. SD6-1]